MDEILLDRSTDMTTAYLSGRSSGISRKIVVSIFGLFLLLSAFLPWISPTSKLGSGYSSASGMNVSGMIGLAAVLGGALVIILAWAPFRSARGGLHIVLGLAVLGVLGLMIFNRTLPLLSAVVRSYVSTGFGVYLYAVSGAAVAIIGVTELPKRHHRIKGTVLTPQPYATSAYGVPPQPPPPAVAASSFCANCGTRFTPGIAFCSGCGTPVPVAYPAAPYYTQPAFEPAAVAPLYKKVSGAWWLLPIFLGVLGGLIAFLAVIKRKPGMAIAMLILGIVLTVAVYLVVRNVSNSLSDLGISVSS